MTDSIAEQAPNAIRPPRRARWLLRGIVAVPVVFLVVAVMLWWTQGRTVANKLKAIRDRGEPVTADDLEDFYARPPADKDATTLWMTAGAKLSIAGETALAKKLPIVGLVEGDPPPPGQPWKELPLAEQFLSDNAAAMQLLHDAAKKGGAARYPTDSSQMLPHMQTIMDVRQCARCLALEAMVRAHRGHAAGAAESLRTGFALARSLKNEPLLVSQLVRIAVCGIANGQLKELLPATDFSDKDLARVQDELLATDFHDGWRRAVLGERVFGIMLFDDPSGLGLSSAMSLASRLVHNGDMTAYLSVMEDYIAAAEQPWPGPLADTKRVSDEMTTRVGQFNIVTQQLVPGFDGCVDSFARITASCRITALAIALERYRRANGKPPEKLDDLAPDYISAVPLDPFTGLPFHYQTSDAGYVVFSLGENKDPVGTDAETGAHEWLLFRWPPKPKPARAADNAGETALGVEGAAAVEEP